ncbi:MAG: MarR family transcriptional regulator [Myxococcota bacterium]
MDRTNEVVHACQREHPTLDASSLLLLLRFDGLARSLEPFLRDVLEPLELAPSEQRVLLALAPASQVERETPTRLAQRLGHTTGGMTKILRRLEERGLVARSTDPDDGRGRRVELTARGDATLGRALRALALAAGHRLASLPPAARDEIADSLGRFAAAFAPASPPPDADSGE